MQAIEFNAQIQNGQIKIPTRFKGFGNKRVKVIILEDTEDPYTNAKKALNAAAKSAQKTGLNQLTPEEINAEIAAVRSGE
jgi:hypothetical protein